MLVLSLTMAQQLCRFEDFIAVVSSSSLSLGVYDFLKAPFIVVLVKLRHEDGEMLVCGRLSPPEGVIVFPDPRVVAAWPGAECLLQSNHMFVS